MSLFRLISIASMLFITACSTTSTYTASELIRRAPDNDIQLAEVIDKTEQFISAEVRWGGSIVKTEKFDNYLRVEVLQRPLNTSGKPDISKSSDGRFVAYISQPYDSKRYYKNRLITINGELTESETKKIGKQKQQTLPVVQSKDFYVWRERYYPHHYAHYYGTGFHYHFGGVHHRHRIRHHHFWHRHW